MTFRVSFFASFHLGDLLYNVSRSNTMVKAYLFRFIAILAIYSIPLDILAEDVPIVDGKVWLESSNEDKRAYLVGVSNFIVLEYAFQQSVDEPPTPNQSSVPDFYQRTDNVSLDQAIAGVDGWYEAHPDKLAKPVLTVLWDIFVKPNL